jgi:hypothetical protein
MKLTLLLPALVLGLIISTSSETLAFGGAPGGPFSNGSFFSNEGTFSAVVRGENLTGILQFSTTAGAGAAFQIVTEDPTTGSPTLLDTNSGRGSTGVATIYYDGDTYIGNSQGALDPQASTMTVMFQADSRQQGQSTQDISIEEVTTSGNTTKVNESQLNYFDSLYINGSANCKTSNAFPNQKFQGDGEAEIQFMNFNGITPLVDADFFPISVTGVRLSNTASSFYTDNVQAPSVSRVSTLVTP